MFHKPFDPSGPAAANAGIFGLPHAPEDAELVLLPVPFDATTSYGHGTAGAPRAILEASHQVELFDLELGKLYERGIAMLPVPEAIEALSRSASEAAAQARDEQRPEAERAAAIARVNRAGAEVNRWVFDTANTWLERGKRVGTIGGDHATPLGAILAHAGRIPGLSLLHIDAHFDLRQGYEGFRYSHASIMHNVMFAPQLTPEEPPRPTVDTLVQVAARDFCEEEHALATSHPESIHPFFDADLAARAMEGEPFAVTAGAIADRLGPNVYVSLDIDGLEPTFCPHTGTPVPGGLHYRQMLALLSAVRHSGRRIVGFDINEVCPGPNGEPYDANVGARLLYKLAGHVLCAPTPARPRSLGFSAR